MCYVRDYRDDFQSDSAMTSNDLSERDEPKRALASVPLSDQLRTLESLVSGLGGGVVIADTEGKFLHFNSAAEEIIGLGACDHPPYRWPEHYGVFLPDTTTMHGWEELPLVRAMRGEEVAESEVFVRNEQRPDGAWCMAVAAPLRDEAGELRGGVVVFRDVTQQKHTAQALREGEEQLRAILNTAVDAIITIDERGTIVEVNAAAEKNFGYTADELIGQNVNVLMPSPFREQHDDYIARYLETREAKIIGIGREVSAMRKDGSTFPADLAVSEVNHLGLFTGVIRDITERKELQRDLLRIADDERRRIGDDLHDGAQQELTGLAMIAQDIAEALSEEASPHAERVGRLAERISDTLDGIRKVAHGLVPVEVDAHGLMAALERLSNLTNELGSVTCAFSCPASVEVHDSFVATHLYRIAQEAVTNALKHAQGDRIEIALSEANGLIKLYVADDGIGIKTERNEREGMGLRIISYRAGLIGASLHISSGEFGGTQMTCTAPVV
jgi:two-component system CheB/CheR fusion protein